MKLVRLSATCVLLSALAPAAFGFEDTKTLPKGIRNLNVRAMTTVLSEKANSGGTLTPLGAALEKSIKMQDLVDNADGFMKTKLSAFMLNEGIAGDESLGSFRADMKGEVHAFVPMFSYGITDRLSIALVTPLIDAASNVTVDFHQNARATQLMEQLTRPENNAAGSAREIAEKLNFAARELNNKLTNHGFKPLGAWKRSGMSDAVIAGKYRFLEATALSMSATGGLVLPTGTPDDPNNLTDLPLGDGNWDTFAQVAADQPIAVAEGLYFNEFAKYTYQFPYSRRVRVGMTSEDIFASEERRVDYKLGDIVEAGASLQYEPHWGLLAGVGRTLKWKFGDRYRDPRDGEGGGKVIRVAETDPRAQFNEARLGYSTIGAYRDGKVPIPAKLSVAYRKQVDTQNSPVADFVELNMDVYF